jgi:hypothetical protein
MQVSSLKPLIKRQLSPATTLAVKDTATPQNAPGTHAATTAAHGQTNTLDLQDPTVQRSLDALTVMAHTQLDMTTAQLPLKERTAKLSNPLREIWTLSANMGIGPTRTPSTL